MEGTLRLSATGEWWHEGSPFTHPELTKLFHRAIVWDEGSKRYLVKIGSGVAHFTYDDTAYFVGEILESPSDWRIVMFDGTIEPFLPATLLVGREHQLYCSVKGGHRARLSRPAHQHLLRYARSDDELEIGGAVIRIRRVD